MAHAIGDSIVFALGVAISPLPVVAVILMLLSRRSGSNSVAFLVGWLAGITAVLVVTLVVAAAVGTTEHGQANHGSSTLSLVLGVALVLMGLRRLRRHPAPGETPAPPKWLTTVEQTTPVRALGLGAVLAALNPKNLILIVGGGLSIAEATATTSKQVVAAVVFVALAASSVAVPVLLRMAGGSRATATLERARGWLELHADAVMGTVLAVLGVALIGRGIGGF